MEEYNKNVSEIIFNQIKGLDFWALARWGCSDIKKKVFGINNGLILKVNTPNCKYGKVEIKLNEGEDLYEIKKFNSRDRLISQVEGVYFDELIIKIESLIETKEYNEVYNK